MPKGPISAGKLLIGGGVVPAGAKPAYQANGERRAQKTEFTTAGQRRQDTRTMLVEDALQLCGNLGHRLIP